MNKYEIGGLCVEMTTAQANRWNAGKTTESDLSRISVAVPEPGNHCRYITLRRALNSRLEPTIFSAMDSMPANPTE